MDHYFTVQHSYQVGVLRYDNICCTMDCYDWFSLHEVMSLLLSSHRHVRSFGCSVLVSLRYCCLLNVS